MQRFFVHGISVGCSEIDGSDEIDFAASTNVIEERMLLHRFEAVDHQSSRIDVVLLLLLQLLVDQPKALVSVHILQIGNVGVEGTDELVLSTFHKKKTKIN